ncbi:HD-GYP domain-containing protein [Marinomonas sp. C2222]|uniref:HD-GYP domain-containing protein n=1 Tax=Marinomonas sargassi TaxID=2984494 RepID=A0ABT2YU92_9GAMM|nr:HD-GYP domain-containing protein [Marinomonas sargassi]MCV2403428.1 HD-GYP domain-containing protein [Marinomonas sargassi]
MSTSDIRTISINQLKPGMYVHDIIKQRGKMQIKSRGKVKNLDIVQQLKKKGILQLKIDLSKAFDPETGELINANKAQQADESTIKKTITKHINFDVELTRAAKLHEQGKTIQREMLDNIANDLPVNIDIPKEFSDNLVGSIDRNPNALMCLSKIREKDSYLMEHSLNVAILLANFAKFLDLPKEEVEELALTGFLHDIGKIKVPDNILHKPGRLTDNEMTVMRKHVIWGTKTLNKMEMPERIIRTMGEHHERLDGGGYQQGKSEDEISKFGRMIAIVDTYDAITADRCYKAGMPSKKALKILLEDSPSKYDLELVRQFIKCIGVYPVGSLVRLNNQQVAMVVSQNSKSPLLPAVKIFYSLRSKIFITPRNVNLAAKNEELEIESEVLASDLGMDFNRFFNENIAT